MSTPPSSVGCAVLHSLRAREAPHERASHTEVARRLGALLGRPFAGDYDPQAAYAQPRYLVPSDTLVGAPQAASLSVATEHDFFGGWVPHPFIATKAITHPLVHADATAPAGWNPDFATAVQAHVLAGFTAFSQADARQAGLQLLADGPIRLKPVRATAGRGQVVIADTRTLAHALDTLDAAELALCGVVLERQLVDVETFSVGQVRVGGCCASYYGVQCLTRDNTGEWVYGGSTLTVARGDFAALLGLALPAQAREAVTQAACYDAAADRCYPALVASRRNYDTLVGTDTAGRRCSGVLEQSWRIGGASGAEVLALAALAADPGRTQVRAATVEVYGGTTPPPPQAHVLFQGDDEDVGPLLKYAVLEPDAPR